MTNAIRPDHLCLNNFTRFSCDYVVPFCEPWDSLFKRAEGLHDEDDLDGAIGLVTAVYDKLVRHQVRALELKSRFHLKKRNYTLALQDATDVIHMAPLMAMGYLLKADVYLAQDQAIEALEVCREALEIISPASCGDAYRAIKARMAQLEAKFIDFTVKLPAEVLPFVFQNLTQDFILTVCMLVSKAWRDRLIHCTPLWQKLQLKKTILESRINSAAYLHVAPCVRRCFGLVDDGILEMHRTSVIYQGMRQGLFSNLCELDIVATNQISEKQAEVFMGLKGIGKSLKKLKITIDFRLSVLQIQRWYPNLCALAYTNDTFVLGQGEQSVLASTKMQSFSVITPAECFDIRTDDYDSKTSPFPNLRRLHIGDSIDADLSDFDERYPFLESLSIDADPSWDFWDEPTTLAGDWPMRLGLSSLSVSPTCVLALMSYVQKHQDTLEHLHLDLTYGVLRFRPGLILPELQFTRLRRLKFTAPQPGPVTEILNVILRSCARYLEKLVMKDFMTIPISTYELMVNIPSLRVVRIHGLANPQGLIEYFEAVFTIQQRQQQQQQQQQQPSLEEVHLEEAKITDEVLEALAHISTLQSVTISNERISGTYTDEGLNWFFGRNALHNSLRHITLSSNKADPTTFKLISKIQSLKTLTLPQHTLFGCQKESFFQFMRNRRDVTINLCVD